MAAVLQDAVLALWAWMTVQPVCPCAGGAKTSSKEFNVEVFLIQGVVPHYER